MSSTREGLLAIPTEPWARFEHVIQAIGMHSIRDLEKTLGQTTFQNILSFLKSIRFTEGFLLIGAGKEYFQAKFLLNDNDAAGRILSEALKSYEPTQAICQLLWGRPGLKRHNVYKLLAFEEYIDPSKIREEDLGSFMMILNQCGLLRYSKKTNDITIMFNPRTSPQPSQLTKFLSPETPYSNLRNIWEVLRTCRSYVHWFDKNFSPKGLELLHDEADGNNISEIKILSGVLEQSLLERIRGYFGRFKEEMASRQIACDFRVIGDKHQLHKIHDRWILSKDVCYNVPPINSIFMGQYSELKPTPNRPPFSEWWSPSLDLLTNWQQILQLTKKAEAEETATTTVAAVAS